MSGNCPELSTSIMQSTGMMMDPEKVPDVQYYKEQAIQCLKLGEFREAALFLTTAIQQETPADPDLYCLRARTYIKMKMLYLAYEDAEKAVISRPNNPDAFICHGEIYMAAGCYEMALMFFGLAAELNPMMEVTDDLLNLVKRASVLGKRSRMMTKRIPWVGAGCGIILGVGIVIANQFIPETPLIRHPALMVLFVIAVSLVGYGLARAYLHYSKMQIAKRLSPPKSALPKVDEKKDESAVDEANGAANNETAALKNRIRYSKAQARQRFKKGKY